MDMDLRRAASIAKMFLDKDAYVRASAIFNAFLAQIEASRPGLKLRLTADDWRRFGEILVLSDVEGLEEWEASIQKRMHEAREKADALLPQGDADPFHSEVERRNGRPVLTTRAYAEEMPPARTTPTFAAPGQEE